MWVGLYYILSHESTYCKPTPLFCVDVRVLAHELYNTYSTVLSVVI